MFQYHCLNPIAEKGLGLFDEEYKKSEDLQECDAVLVRSAKMHDMELPESVKVIARAGAGVNNIPIKDCAEKGVVVFNTPGANANGVKELVLAGMLLASRDIVGGIEWVAQEKDKEHIGKLAEKQKKQFAGCEIMGKKLGIMKCPDCQDGYLIVKFSENRQYFLGCTNYQNNGKGCNKTLSAKEYYKLMGYDVTELDWLPKKEIKEENTKPQQKTIEYVSHNEQHKNDNWEQKILDQNADSGNSRKKYPEYKGHSLFEIVETIMNALVHISEKKYFGVSILSGVLRGSNAEKIKKNGLDKVKEYDALSYLSGEEVTRLIYWLIGRHYIIKTTGQYPVLHITSEGLKYAELFTPRIAGNLLKWLETEADRRLLDEQDI